MDDAINNGNGDGLEQPKKRKRGGSNESEPIIISPAEHHKMKTDADVWWHSGDARKLFAPTNVYGNGSDVRKIVLERIGIMEDVNNHWDSWGERWFMVVTQIIPAPVQISSQFAFEVCIWHMQ